MNNSEASEATRVPGLLPFLTVADLAYLLHKTPWVVNKMARLGQLPGAKRIGREWFFRRNDIRRFVEGKELN